MTTLPESIVKKLEQSALCQLLYQSYLKMGNSGSFTEFANECWNCYKADSLISAAASVYNRMVTEQIDLDTESKTILLENFWDLI